jgi:DNA-binding XRE family transcriptional regulator
MDKWEFLMSRRKFGYTQEEAAEELGVARGTVVRWESGIALIPKAIELACCELIRRSRRAPFIWTAAELLQELEQRRNEARLAA